MPNKLSILLFYCLHIFAGGGGEICFIFSKICLFIYIHPKNEGQGLRVLKPELKNQGLHLVLNKILRT